jgi:hypothetical protein
MRPPGIQIITVTFQVLVPVVAAMVKVRVVAAVELPVSIYTVKIKTISYFNNIIIIYNYKIYNNLIIIIYSGDP